MSPELFRNILYSLSGLSFGAAAYALYAYLFLLRNKHSRANAVGHILVKVSWLLTVGVIFWTILIPLTAIEPTVEGWFYATGILLGAIGFITIARTERLEQEREREKAKSVG